MCTFNTRCKDNNKMVKLPLVANYGQHAVVSIKPVSPVPCDDVLCDKDTEQQVTDQVSVQKLFFQR